jgi:hypothetical protein
MKKIFTTSVLVFAFMLFSHGQNTVRGVLKDAKGKPVVYANVFVKSSGDGAVTDSSGKFEFQTALRDTQLLKASCIGYKTLEYPIVIKPGVNEVSLKMAVMENNLGEVVINAGTIAASDERTVAILKPLDIVTIAGGQADIAGAIQTLPGVQRNGGDVTGLMVRGGDVTEATVIVDGTVAQDAFFSAVPGIAQRSRFSPFDFKGTSFSSGGYSARYGQAMSSILDLETQDLPEKSTLNTGANFAGVYAGGAVLMGENAIEINAAYNNLTPYYLIARTNNTYYYKPQGGSASARWISKLGDKGYFKMNMQYNYYKVGVTIPNPDSANQLINFGLQNENIMISASYKYYITPKLKFFSDFGYSYNEDNIQWGSFAVLRKDDRLQGRAEIEYQPVNQFNLLAGVEVQRYFYSIVYDTLSGQFYETMPAAYIEANWKPVAWFGIKLGARGEYSALLNKFNGAPRASLAFRTGKQGQISAAGGMFYQSAPSQYLLEGYRPNFQLAVHYMLNYQWIRDDRTLRVEAYYKNYYDLIREQGLPYDPNPYRWDFGYVNNSGSGYARGIDFFWRDKKSIKNFDYWISYSYIDTRRLYQNYLAKVTPDYISPHDLNIILKYFIDKINTNISVSYFYASGRHYYNPNETSFFEYKAPDYHNLAATISYLLTLKKVFMVFYVSGDNIINHHNILGYRYSDNGQTAYPILPPTYASVFIGFNISLTPFKRDEL